MIRRLNCLNKKKTRTWGNILIKPTAKFKLFKACDLSAVYYGALLINPTVKQLKKIGMNIYIAVRRTLSFHRRTLSYVICSSVN